MAQLKGFGIDLGQHSVKLAELRKDRSGVRLVKAKIASTGITPAMSKEAKEKAVASALKKVLEGVDVGQNPVAIATPGLSAFIRYVKLPPVTPQRLKQIIGYEAQQQVPFSLNEVIWDYQVLDVRSEAETNVVLVAIKKDVLSALISSVKTCGIEPSFVEHRPLAVYNSIKFNYDTVEGGVIVIIDVGERTTDISVERDGELCWTRSARIGSADITEAIRKKYNVSPEEAERIKEEEAVILASDESEKSAGSETLELWNVIRRPVSDIVAELQRTINYFQTQLGGTRADKIIITGGLSMMPNLDALLGAIIGAEVEKLNPLKKISMDEGLLGDIDAGAHLSVALGLGLRSLDEGFSEVNLLPESIVSRQQLRKKRAYLVLSGISLGLMIGIATVFSDENYNVAQRNVKAVQKELGDYQDYNKLIKEERQKQERIDAKLENMQELVSKFWAWPDFLLETARVVPEGVTVYGLRFVAGEARPGVRGRAPMDDPGMIRETMRREPAAPEPGKKKLEMRGRANNFDRISALISVVESSPMFKSVDIISAEPVVVAIAGTPEPRARRAPAVQRAPRAPVAAADEETVVREYIDFVVRVEVEEDAFP